MWGGMVVGKGGGRRLIDYCLGSVSYDVPMKQSVYLLDEFDEVTRRDVSA